MLMPSLMGESRNPSMIPQENKVVHIKNAVSFFMLLTTFHPNAHLLYTTTAPKLQQEAGKIYFKNRFTSLNFEAVYGK
jgi:hypothetical protein